MGKPTFYEELHSAFSTHREADKLVAKLKRNGKVARVAKLKHQDGKITFGVLVAIPF